MNVIGHDNPGGKFVEGSFLLSSNYCIGDQTSDAGVDQPSGA